MGSALLDAAEAGDSGGEIDRSERQRRHDNLDLFFGDFEIEGDDGVFVNVFREEGIQGRVLSALFEDLGGGMSKAAL